MVSSCELSQALAVKSETINARQRMAKNTEQIQQAIVLYQSHDRQPEKIYRCVEKHIKDIHTSGFIDLA